MAEPRDDVEVKGPAGISLRARGTDIVGLLVFLITTAQAGIIYMHMDDAKKTGEAVAATNRQVAAALQSSNVEFSRSLNEVVKAQRLATCLAATEPAKKEAEYMKPDSFCNRVSQ